MSTIGRVDAHTHIFHPDVAEDRFRYFPQDAAFHELYQAPDARIVVTEQLVNAMDGAGIARSIACGFGWSANALCREGNDAIIEAVRLYPSRVTGFGTVAPRESLSESLAEIDRLAAAGVRGLGELRPDTQGLLELEPRDIDSLAERVKGHGMGLLMHASEPVGRTYPGKGTATPERLYGLLERLRGIPVILAHAGGGLPFYANLRASEDVFADVYVDTAAMPYLYEPAAVRALISSIGHRTRVIRDRLPSDATRARDPLSGSGRVDVCGDGSRPPTQCGGLFGANRGDSDVTSDVPAPPSFRAFIAVVPPKSIRAELSALVRQLRNLDTDGDVRWVTPDSMHITLAFLGQLPESKAAPLTSALEKAVVGMAAFDLSIGRLGTFGERRRRGGAQVIWSGLEGDVVALGELHERVSDAVRHVGLRVESRGFQPHFTLGRVRRGRSWRLDVVNAPSVPSAMFRVTEVTLMESRLGRGPAVYVERGAVRLTARGGHT